MTIHAKNNNTNVLIKLYFNILYPVKNNSSVANIPVKIRAASKSFSPFITGVKPPITIAANASLAKSKKKPAISPSP